MKTFIDICKMTQIELKKYLEQYLKSKGYEVVNADGYLFAEPRKHMTVIPVMLIAHMDTVHKERIKEVQILPTMLKDGSVETRISSPQGIGGDDRCGIWAIMNLIKEYNTYVLFVEDEEVGGVGSDKFTKSDEINNVDIKYMIEIDRRGNNDAVFYSCDNKEFTKWIEDNTKFEKAYGSFTDISTLMPTMGIAGVNFSSGYYNAHTKDEYVVEEELNEIIDRIGDLLSLEIPKTFEYVKRVGGYGYGTYSGYGKYAESYYENDLDDWYSTYYLNRWKKYQEEQEKDAEQKAKQEELEEAFVESKEKPFDSDTLVKLTVWSNEAMDIYGMNVFEATGNTKPECWMNLFMDYSDLSFSMVDDYLYE